MLLYTQKISFCKVSVLLLSSVLSASFFFNRLFSFAEVKKSFGCAINLNGRETPKPDVDNYVQFVIPTGEIPLLSPGFIFEHFFSGF